MADEKMTDEQTFDLLPCPFCGSPAAEPWFDDDAERGDVYCSECAASIQGAHCGWMSEQSDRDKSISEAIDAWNTRTAMQPALAEADALKRSDQ